MFFDQQTKQTIKNMFISSVMKTISMFLMDLSQILNKVVETKYDNSAIQTTQQQNNINTNNS